MADTSVVPQTRTRGVDLSILVGSRAGVVGGTGGLELWLKLNVQHGLEIATDLWSGDVGWKTTNHGECTSAGDGDGVDGDGSTEVHARVGEHASEPVVKLVPDEDGTVSGLDPVDGGMVG